MSTRARWTLPVGLAAVLVLAVGTWLAVGGPSEDDLPAPPPAVVEAPPAPASVPPAPPVVARAKDGGLDLVGAAVARAEAESQEEPAKPYPVDLAALKAKLPGNLYWETSVPTQDPEELRRREQVQKGWNALFGKVQSNEATEEEVRRYYAHRRQVSEDAITFATTMLQDYGDQLPSEHRGLLELSVRMHRTRLDEMPRQEQDALARREAQAKRQRDWKAGPPAPSP